MLNIIGVDGVNYKSMYDYLNAGCYAVAFARPLFALDDMNTKNYKNIEKRARMITKKLALYKR